MPVEVIQANPKVRADAGKVAIQRGPLVYCLEEIDNGENLSALSININSGFTTGVDGELPNCAVVIKGKAMHTSCEKWEDALYKTYSVDEREVEFKAIPYFMWGNRKPGEMLVWVNKK